MCLQLGIDDPEKWLASKPRRVIELWEAYWRLEPWGLEWHRSSALMTMMDSIRVMFVRWLCGGKSKIEPKPFSHWMPGDWADDANPVPTKKLTIKEQLDIVAAAFTRNRR